jgi:hypothetical protein
MTGLNMMLKSLGVNINPAEIEAAFAQVKQAIPAMVGKIQEMDLRLQRIEQTQAHILRQLEEARHGVAAGVDDGVSPD